MFTVAGTATFGGEFAEETGSGVTRLKGISTINVQKSFVIDGGRTLQIESILDWNGGVISLGDNTSTLGVGNSIFNLGTIDDTFNGSVTSGNSNDSFVNLGTISVSSGSGLTEIDARLTNNNSGILNIATGTLSLQGENNILAGTVTGEGTLIIGIPGNGGDIPTTTFGELTIANTTKINITNAIVNQTDNLTLLDTGTGSTVGTFTIEADSTYNITNNFGITGSDTTGNWQTITNKGTLAKTAGTGFSQIGVAIDNQGAIVVESGFLSLAGPLSGNGYVYIGNNSTLDLTASSPVPSTNFIDFENYNAGQTVSNNATIAIDDIAGVASGAEIAGFDIGSNNTIDFQLLSYSNQYRASFVYTNQQSLIGNLTITEGNKAAVLEQVTLFGNFVNSGFQIATDGSGGTAITYTPPSQAQHSGLASSLGG